MTTTSAIQKTPSGNGDGAVGDVCLCVIFNHKYVANIPKLLGIYGSRFRHIRFIVPFLTDEEMAGFGDCGLIPVYESSLQFQGYIAQAWRSIAEQRFTHTVFVADDLLLHPSLNEANIIGELGLDAESAYIKTARPLLSVDLRWRNLLPALRALRTSMPAHFRAELPSPAAAQALLARHGFPDCAFRAGNMRGLFSLYRSIDSLSAANLATLLRLAMRRAAIYPAAMGYSDFVVIPNSALEEFAHICGVFAAMGLFVEVAIPTAILWSCCRVVREADLPWRGTEIWEASEVDELEQRHERLLPLLLGSYGEHQLYIHPIKLSRWRTDADVEAAASAPAPPAIRHSRGCDSR